MHPEPPRRITRLEMATYIVLAIVMLVMGLLAS